MRPRVRVVLLVCAALAATAPLSGAAAQTARSAPAISHSAVDQPLTWSIMPSPNARTRGTTHNSYLTGISCPSATSCTAVGYWSSRSAQKTLIESWNGTTWSIVPSPAVAGANPNSALQSVWCASPATCLAAGSRNPDLGHGPGRTLVACGTSSSS